MTLIKKYYEGENGNEGGGAAAETVVETKPQSLAEAMASGGKVGILNEAAKPIENKVEEKETKVDESTTAATATTDTETKATETTTTATTEKVAESTKETATQSTWQEVLKQQQPTQVLKELGLGDDVISLVDELKDVDPKVVAFLKEYKEKGADGIVPFLKEWTTDYSKMSAEEVMRNQLRAEYPKASDKAIDAIFKDEVVSKYNLDSDDDDEVEEGRLKLEAKAEKYRDTLIEKQKDFLLPKPIEKNNDAELEEQKQIQLQNMQIEQYRKGVIESPYVKDMFTNKKLTIGEGEDTISYPIENPSELTDLVLDGAKWRSEMIVESKGANGETIYSAKDPELQMLVSALVKDKKAFLNSIATQYKSIGAKSITDSIENAKTKEIVQPQRSQSESGSLAGEMASKGRVVQGSGW